MHECIRQALAQVRGLEDAASLPAAARGAEASAPQSVARHASEFLDAHLRMDDVRRYLLDLLKTYAALQTFQVGTEDQQDSPSQNLELRHAVGRAAVVGSRSLTSDGEAAPDRVYVGCDGC